MISYQRLLTKKERKKERKNNWKTMSYQRLLTKKERKKE